MSEFDYGFGSERRRPSGSSKLRFVLIFLLVSAVTAAIVWWFWPRSEEKGREPGGKTGDEIGGNAERPLSVLFLALLVGLSAQLLQGVDLGRVQLLDADPKVLRDVALRLHFVVFLPPLQKELFRLLALLKRVRVGPVCHLFQKALEITHRGGRFAISFHTSR